MNHKEYTVRVFDSGDIHWFKLGHNLLHREDGPAVIYNNGDKIWYKEGKIHRENGPAKLFNDGCEVWFKDGKTHREGGPASIWTNGTKKWFQDDHLHRLDGPAIESNRGYKAYYINGEWLSEKDFNEAIKKPAPCEGKMVEIDGIKYTLTKAK